MDCYMCATWAGARSAVAICPHCGAGLCLEHLRESAVQGRRGGLFTGCLHDTWTTAKEDAQQHESLPRP